MASSVATQSRSTAWSGRQQVTPYEENCILRTQSNQPEAHEGNDAPGQPNSELLAAIAEHRSTAVEHIAYVVPMSELWAHELTSNQNCLVVPLRGFRSDNIDVTDENFYACVRARDDRTSLECLMMARGQIALTGAAVRSAGAQTHGLLHVLWSFDNEWVFSKYRFSDGIAEDMWVAASIAQSSSSPTKGPVPHLRLADSRRVIDVSDYVVVGVPEVS